VGDRSRAVSRRPPIPLYTMVPRTGGYTYAVGVWDLSIIQGPFSVAPCQTLTLRFATCSSRCVRAGFVQTCERTSLAGSTPSVSYGMVTSTGTSKAAPCGVSEMRDERRV
jgi:hypothetical protein